MDNALIYSGILLVGIGICTRLIIAEIKANHKIVIAKLDYIAATLIDTKHR